MGRVKDECSLRRREGSLDEDGEASRGQSKRALDAMLELFPVHGMALHSHSSSGVLNMCIYIHTTNYRDMPSTISELEEMF